MPRKPSLSRSLVRWLESASAPIYLLDSQRRIVFGNAAFSRWVNRPAEDLAGVRCDYHTSVGVSGSIELAAALWAIYEITDLKVPTEDAVKRARQVAALSPEMVGIIGQYARGIGAY